MIEKLKEGIQIFLSNKFLLIIGLIAEVYFIGYTILINWAGCFFCVALPVYVYMTIKDQQTRKANYEFDDELFLKRLGNLEISNEEQNKALELQNAAIRCRKTKNRATVFYWGSMFFFLAVYCIEHFR